MQLIQRAANGNYSKLLEATIADYRDYMDKLSTVRNIAKATVITKQLCAFYDIKLPSLEQGTEEDWLLELHANNPARELRKSGGLFAELQLMAYGAGAIDYMLDCPEDSSKPYSAFYGRFLKMIESGNVSKDGCDVLTELWAAGFVRQQKQFENR